MGRPSGADRPRLLNAPAGRSATTVHGSCARRGEPSGQGVAGAEGRASRARQQGDGGVEAGPVRRDAEDGAYRLFGR
ncbi:hypothetical protein ACICHK_01605 [Streptomyces sp. AHU1]|uniref:hypothetical protein n=1 Tax=Streptomyces sp. AHU1 TaxID=3377215 RepID=UPI003877CB81